MMIFIQQLPCPVKKFAVVTKRNDLQWKKERLYVYPNHCVRFVLIFLLLSYKNTFTYIINKIDMKAVGLNFY